MAITRINHPESNTIGWQARAHVAPGRRLTRFFADQTHGGMAKAYDMAAAAERRLKRRARALPNAELRGRPLADGPA